MSDLHSLGIYSDDPTKLEFIPQDFAISKLITYQAKTRKLVQDIRDAVKVGITESEGRQIALEVSSAHGVKKHWHQPYLRFGPGTLLTYNDSAQENYHLQKNDAFYIDLGPVWNDDDSSISYEGDFGDTYVLGNSASAKKCADTARQLFHEAQEQWRLQKLSGKNVYHWLNERAQSLGYHFLNKIDGHRIGDFPHHKSYKGGLSQVAFTPSHALWVLEVQIQDISQNIGAFYEDILLSP